MSVTETVSPADVLAAWGNQLDESSRAVDELEPAARAVAKAHAAALNEVTRAGLELIIKELKAHAATKNVLFDLVDYPQVRMLFAMHGLIRLPDQSENATGTSPKGPAGGPVISVNTLFQRPDPNAAPAGSGCGSGGGGCGCG